MVAFSGGFQCFLCDQAAGCGCPHTVYAGAALDHSGPREAPEWAQRVHFNSVSAMHMPLDTGC